MTRIQAQAKRQRPLALRSLALSRECRRPVQSSLASSLLAKSRLEKERSHVQMTTGFALRDLSILYLVRCVAAALFQRSEFYGADLGIS